MMFSRKALTRLLVPLIIEQFLAMAVGMLDIIMVASAGEASVSGVSSVDSVNVLLILALSAMATGGAIVASQYIGRKDYKNACIAANQLILVTFVIGMLLLAIGLLGNGLILRLLLGNIDQEVMDAARVYFYLSALSYPFLGVYNGCAAIYRAMGNSRVSMMTSLLMNVINIVGNAAFVFIFHMGAAGVGLATLISRIAAAIIMVVIVRNSKNVVHVNKNLRLGYYPKMIKNILRIGIPNGLENAMFQFGKVVLQGLIATLGSSAIAANAVAGNLAGMEVIPGLAIGIGMLTVVGQCIGAGEHEQAKKYAKKLLILSYVLQGASCLLIILISKPLIGIYSLSAETSQLAQTIILLHSIVGILIWPPAFTLPSAFRAAGDVKFTMVVSIVSMWLFRIILGFIFVKVCDFGVVGVWVAMFVDWFCRMTFFGAHFVRGKWLRKAVI